MRGLGTLLTWPPYLGWGLASVRVANLLPAVLLAPLAAGLAAAIR
jgi:hypothetical protein